MRDGEDMDELGRAVYPREYLDIELGKEGGG